MYRPPRPPARVRASLSIVALLAGCADSQADELLVFLRDADGSYRVGPRAIESLADPVAMTGDLGTVTHGGRFTGDVALPDYSGGGPVEVRFVTRDGVGVPLDEDGLLLWSFWAHLQDARDALGERGVDLDPIFPLAIAWNPAVNWEFELAPVDNAAYAIGTNLFLLLPDGDDRDVPLVANAGVVTHEVGHAVFQLLTVGDPHAEPLIGETDTVPALWQASLHEGFADTLASLLLDDPRFLTASLDMPEREVDGAAVLTDDLTPEAAVEAMDDPLAIYDPYPLGTVFASAFWDIRVATDDPDATLALVVRTLRAWAPRSADAMDGYPFLDAVVAQAAPGAEATAVCDAFRGRFDGFWEGPACF